MNILFVILWATDLIMFVFAVEHTVSVGVGGMVLFASEVCTCLHFNFLRLIEFLVWYTNGQRLKHHAQISAVNIRSTSCWS